MVKVDELLNGWAMSGQPEQAPASQHCAPGLKQAAFVEFATRRTGLQEAILAFRDVADARRFVDDAGFSARCPSLSGPDKTFAFAASFSRTLPLKINATVHQGTAPNDRAYRVYFHVGRYVAQLLFNGDPTQDQSPPVLSEIESAVTACINQMRR